MKEQLTKLWGGCKDFWNKQPPQRKKIAKIVSGAVLAGALLLVLLLNWNALRFRELWPGMESGETREVYALLRQDMPEAEAKIDGGQKLLVRSDQYDEAMMLLSEQGYPKTTLTYDYLLNDSFTATESDKRNALVIQTQDNIAKTLMRGYDGVQEAIVLLNLPVESSHVWDQAQQNTGSASVKMVMRTGYTLTPTQVTGIKNLVAHAARDILAENVVVTDGSNLPLSGADEADGMLSVDWLKYQRQIAQEYESNVIRLLGQVYGDGNVIPVASVRLNIDKMISERMTLVPKEDGSGYTIQRDEDYTINGTVPAAGIAGEENNTDTPQYLQGDPNEEGGTTDYHSSATYDYSYDKTQTEKVTPLIEQASISVMINDTKNQLSQQQIADHIVQIANATGISQANISLASVNPIVQPAGPGGLDNTETKPWWQALEWYIWAVVGFILLLLIVLFILVRRHGRAKVEAAEQESEEIINSLQEEIEERKRQLAEAAQQDSDPSGGAIVQEVRDFARDNPEITANLIRSWLKEDP